MKYIFNLASSFRKPLNIPKRDHNREKRGYCISLSYTSMAFIYKSTKETIQRFFLNIFLC